MSIPNKRPLQRRPVHPGEILRDEFMTDYELTVSGLASALGVSRQSINELLRERRAVSPEMALRLAKFFGNSADFWLNLQRAVDLHQAKLALADEMRNIKPLRVA
ncbi:HigA family addiction module antitoxin [Desulfomicrobium salsuginis]